MSNSVLKAGCGLAEMIFPPEFFQKTDDEGRISFVDGFCGKVHSFQGKKGTITDNLCTRVLLIENGLRVAVVALEIAQAPADQVEYTQNIVGDICGVRPENVWVHTTHQFGFMHRPDDAEKAAVYDSVMKEAAEKAARMAMDTFEEAVIGIGTGQCHVSANKNILPPEGVGGGPYYGPGSTLETNPEMTLIRFSSKATGKDIGYFLSYGTKPSALCTVGKSEGNRLVNTEVTGHASKLMEERFSVPCLFCMPAAGDQYPRRTAQYYGFDKDGKWTLISLGFEEGIKIVDELGQEMADDAVRIAGQIDTVFQETPISNGKKVFEYDNKAGDRKIPISINAITVGDIAFVGFKQEMDCLTELQLKERSPYGTTLTVSFLNGDGKYFGHLEAYDFNSGIGTWETARSAYAKGAAEAFVQEAAALLKDMKDGTYRESPEVPEAKSSQTYSFDEVMFAGRPWYVLDRKGQDKLLLSKDIIEKRSYNDGEGSTSWEKCSLRKYLNGEFYDAFSEKEKADIIETELLNNSNPKYATAGGNNTKDKIFLLSLDEAMLYLEGFQSILSARDRDGNKTWWFLRSPGEAEDVAASVDANGMIDFHGVSDSLDAIIGGIRLAMWVRSR